MIKGVIFDYNGTLMFDLDCALDAWHELYELIMGTRDGFDDDIAKICFCLNTRTIIERIYEKANIKPTEEMIQEYSGMIGGFYQKSRLKRKMFTLATGAYDVVKYCKDQGYPVNMCTASREKEVNFYFEHTDGLSELFDRKIVSFDDGIVQGKVSMYQEACSRIVVKPEETLVFEDSRPSIECAIQAGVKKIIYVNHFGRDKIEFPEIIQEVYDFTEFDRSLLHKFDNE